MSLSSGLTITWGLKTTMWWKDQIQCTDLSARCVTEDTWTIRVMLYTKSAHKAPHKTWSAVRTSDFGQLIVTRDDMTMRLYRTSHYQWWTRPVKRVSDVTYRLLTDWMKSLLTAFWTTKLLTMKERSWQNLLLVVASFTFFIQSSVTFGRIDSVMHSY